MLNDPDPAKRGEIEDGTKKAFLKPQMPGWESGQEGKRAFGPCSRYTLAYVEPRLSPPDAAPTPADEGRGTLRTVADRGQLNCRITGRSASEPLGPHCSTPPGYGGPIRDQPPARTRPVLRSAAQSQTPTSTYLLATNSGGQQRSASRTEAAQTSRPRQRVFHQMLRADVRTHGDHIAAVRTISTNEIAGEPDGDADRKFSTPPRGPSMAIDTSGPVALGRTALNVVAQSR